MTRLFSFIRDYASSLAGRIALLLMLGLAGASIASLLVAEHLRIRSMQSLQLERVVASTTDIWERFIHDPQATQTQLDQRALFGVRIPIENPTLGKADERLPAMLRERLPEGTEIGIQRITSDCFGGVINARNRIAGRANPPAIDCWLVSFNDANGDAHSVIVDLPGLQIPRNGTLDPTYLVLIVIASALVSIFAARLTTVPLRRLTIAAHRFSVSIDPESIPESGPAEVRTALKTFNTMQERVREGFLERTQILSAIAHDLQTPLTRLRLRLEQVEDERLRAKLLNDLAAMHELVRDGLELARSSDVQEEWSEVDIASMLTSIVEDAEELGADIRLVRNCDIIARVRPNALMRCLQNLVSNALKYAGNAEISCAVQGQHVEITVMDNGPGFPVGREQDMLEPFVRGDESRSRKTGGTGIGLTIAMAQAKTFGGNLTIGNRPQGGAFATVSFCADGRRRG